MKYYKLHDDDAIWSNLENTACSTLLFEFQKEGHTIREMYKLPKNIVEYIRKQIINTNMQLLLVDAFSGEQVMFRQSALEFIVVYGTEMD